MIKRLPALDSEHAEDMGSKENTPLGEEANNGRGLRRMSSILGRAGIRMSALARQFGASTPVLSGAETGSETMNNLRDLNFLRKVHYLAKGQWLSYRPGCVNILRVLEVSLLGILVGILFYNVGNDPSSIGLSQKTSLLFFSVTLWTFTRMYPSVGSTHAWFHQTIDTASFCHSKRFKSVFAMAAWSSRLLVSFSCEGK